jgi:hypothetical protein
MAVVAVAVLWIERRGGRQRPSFSIATSSIAASISLYNILFSSILSRLIPFLFNLFNPIIFFINPNNPNPNNMGKYFPLVGKYFTNP